MMVLDRRWYPLVQLLLELHSWCTVKYAFELDLFDCEMRGYVTIKLV